ncbi:ABC transporter permease [Umezawaea tangerina]|uniref:ABC-2 type transport system permease protein n=1 Tax=Umezawaea tangerina TaxID=84725 RepID=A0A2T0T3Z1_9PSEU|nr:ABC transporter permease [Umezawaea tangerina]PRY40344.1 ABC-2 type transport system permease protein [Umezawaea tangerina]
MLKVIRVEAKLYLREGVMAYFSLLFPTILLLVLGAIPMLRSPDPTFGGLRFIDGYVGTLVVITLGYLGLQRVPTTVATYREKGVLRRLSTTPLHPAKVLTAQLVVNLAAAVTSVVLVVAAGKLVFDIDLPHHPVGFVLATLLGATSLFALGLVIAALAPTARAATGVAGVLFILIMFFGGAYLPRFLLPEAVNTVGRYLPPGVAALQNAWVGTAPEPLHLVIMALITAFAGTVAARTFRWE